MNLKEAVDLLHKKFGTHTKAANYIGYTPEYYNSIRTLLKNDKKVPSSAQSRIIAHAFLVRFSVETVAQKEETATV